MQKQRSSNTTPEVALRGLLHKRGLRYRLHREIVPGTRRKVDIVFPAPKVAVDVRGCFWHGHAHDLAKYGATRKKNLDYWIPKIDRNRARDLDTQRRLKRSGWKVIVVWECDDLEKVTDRIELAVRQRNALS
jgi:DNA mismatch endonuclease (patch repair protein)